MINVVCGILIQNGKVMIAQRNYGSSKGMFEFPGGKVEWNESNEEALIREWKEECDIQIERIQYFAQNLDHQDGKDLNLYYYVFTSKEKPSLHVHSQFVWTIPEKIYDYPFFEADRHIVNQLMEEWPCLIEQMK